MLNILPAFFVFEPKREEVSKLPFISHDFINTVDGSIGKRFNKWTFKSAPYTARKLMALHRGCLSFTNYGLDYGKQTC